MFVVNPSIFNHLKVIKNPLTGKLIKINGPTYLKLVREGISLDDFLPPSTRVMNLYELVEIILNYLDSPNLNRFRSINKTYRQIASGILLERVIGPNIKLIPSKMISTLLESCSVEVASTRIKNLYKILPSDEGDHLALSVVYDPRFENEVDLLRTSILKLHYPRSVPYHIKNGELIILYARRGANLVELLGHSAEIQLPDPEWKLLKTWSQYLFPEVDLISKNYEEIKKLIKTL